MTDVQFNTNGHRNPSGAAASSDQGSGEFVNALRDAVRANPVSAALIGMGVLWMFMGGSNTSLFGGDGRKSIFRTAAQGAGEIDGAVRDTAGRVGSSVGRAASAAGKTVAHAAAAVRDASAAAGDVASRGAAQASEAVSSAYGATADMAARTVPTISSATTALQEAGTRWGNTVHQNLSDLFERQPLLLGAVGVAIGAGIAASIPITHAENKIMCEASEAMRNTATEKAAQVKEMAEAALHEAKTQGMTPGTAGAAVRTLADKMIQSLSGNPAQQHADSAFIKRGPPPGSKKT
jgi:hypothetical protein